MMLLSRVRGLALTVAAVMFLSEACDDGPVGTSGGVRMSISPAQLSIEQGGSGSVTVAVARSGGFTGVVHLAIAGFPSGVTATITPTELSNAVSSATIEMMVDLTVPAAAYIGTVIASGDGIDQATTTYALAVTALSEYAISVVPSTLTIVAGASSSATVGIERTNVDGDVALALVSPPAGITGEFDATSRTADAEALIVSVAAGVAPGTYALTVEGTHTSLGVRSATLTIVVPSPPQGANVEYRFCDASSAPIFVAYQDGTGAWQPVTGVTSADANRYAFNLTQGYGGVLFVYREAGSAQPISGAKLISRRPIARRSLLATGLSAAPGTMAVRGREEASRVLQDTYFTEIQWASTTELAQVGVESCAPPTMTVTGTVAGVPLDAFGRVSFGYTTDIFIGGTSTNPVTFDAPQGFNDLAASRVLTAGTPPDRIVVFRNLDVPDGGSLPSVIDFDGPASSVPATALVTTTGGGGDDLEAYTDLVTANSWVGLWADLAPSPVSTRPWAGLGASAMQSGDLHSLVVFATPANRPGDFRVTLELVGPVGNRTLALGPDIAEPVSSQVIGGAYPRLRFQGTLPSEYAEGAYVDMASEDGSGNAYSMIATGAYLAASGNRFAYDLEMPDVAGLTGFPIAARLAVGTNDVSVSGFGFDGPGIFDPRPTLGARFRAAAKGLTIVVN